MNLLKRENWWLWLLLNFFSGGAAFISLAVLLDVLDENAWYAKWQNWLIGIVCFFFPFFIMMTVFFIQMECQVAAKLGVKGSEYYLSVYVWLLLLIIPIIGWTLLAILMIYIFIWTLVALYKGEGEAYIK